MEPPRQCTVAHRTVKKPCGSSDRLVQNLNKVGTVENGWKLVRYIGYTVEHSQRRARWLCHCVSCKNEVVRAWGGIKKHACGKCWKGSGARERRLAEGVRIHVLKKIPRRLLRKRDAIDAIVEVFGPLTRNETAVVMGRIDRGRPYSYERIRQIEARAIRKLKKRIPARLKESYKEREQRPPTIWEKIEEEQ